MKNIAELRTLFKDFHFRQRFMMVLLASLAVLFLFYGAFTIFGEAVDSSAQRSEDLRERIVNVKTRMARIEKNSSQTKILTTGLLTYVQSLNGQMSAEGKVTNIKMLNTTMRQEQVSFKTENLVYNDFVKLLKEFEGYGNLQIKSLAVNKRFDNPKRVDALWDMVRAEQ